MTTQPTKEGLLEAWGLDSRSETSILNDRAQAVTKAALEGYKDDAKTAGQRALNKGSAAAGALLAGWAAKKKGLTPEQTQQMAIKEDAATAWQELSSKPEFGKMDHQQKAAAYATVMANAAYKNGRGDIGSQIGMEAWNAKRGRMKSDIEMRKLGQDVDMGDLNIRGKQLDNQSKVYGNLVGKVKAESAQALMDYELTNKQLTNEGLRRDGVVPIWMKGSSDPNGSEMAYVKADGTAVQVGQDGKETIYAPGEYTTVNPEVNRLYKSGQLTMTPTASESLRQQLLAQRRSIQISNNALEALADAQGEEGQVNILGASGKAIGSYNKFIATLAGVTREAGGKFWSTDSVDDEGKVIGKLNLSPDGKLDQKSTQRILKNNPELREKFEKLASASGTDVSIFTSHALGLQVARARANEPKANQLTESDLARAASETGANANSVEALRGIFRNNYRQAVSDMNSQLGILPDGTAEQIMNVKWFDGLQQDIDLGRTYTEDSFGENSNADLSNVSENRPNREAPENFIVSVKGQPPVTDVPYSESKAAQGKAAETEEVKRTKISKEHDEWSAMLEEFN